MLVGDWMQAYDSGNKDHSKRFCWVFLTSIAASFHPFKAQLSLSGASPACGS